MTATTWNFDLSHSSVNFAVRHMMIAKVRGRFQIWSGTLVIDDEDLTRSRVEVSIDAASVDTRDDKRDAHLRSADFFDVAQFPQLTFTSRTIERVGGDALAIHGDLTIRGITRPVTLDVELNGEAKDPWGGLRQGFEARATVNRKDFGLHWNAALETGGVLVGDRVEISLDVQAVKAAATRAA
jgi:polyisoprenoid-binding protein YceI